MTRKKLNLSYISNYNARKITLQHRKKGLLKKLDELKILCDIDGGAMIYNPLNTNLEVWPSNFEMDNVIQKFGMMTKTEQMLRSVNHNEFLNQQIAKAEKQNKKLIDDNKEKYMKELMFACLGGGNMEHWNVNNNDLINLCEFIHQYLKFLFHHRNVIRKDQDFEIGDSSSSMAMPRDTAPTTMAQACPSSFLCPPIFNFFQLTSEFQSIISSNQRPKPDNSQLTNGLQSIVSSNQRPEHFHSLANSLVSTIIFNSPQLTSELPSMVSSNHGSGNVDSLASDLLPNNDQKVCIPVVTQNEDYYHTQTQDQEDEFVEEMLKLSEETRFHWMEEILPPLQSP